MGMATWNLLALHAEHPTLPSATTPWLHLLHMLLRCSSHSCSSLGESAHITVLFSIFFRQQLKCHFAGNTPPPLEKVKRKGPAGWLRQPGIEQGSAVQLPTPAQVAEKQLSASQTSIP